MVKVIKNSMVFFEGNSVELLRGVIYKSDAKIVRQNKELFENFSKQTKIEVSEPQLLVEEPVEALKVEVKEEPVQEDKEVKEEPVPEEKPKRRRTAKKTTETEV